MIGAWFDWALVVEMARSLPKARFDLIGPVMIPPPPALPANVRLLGECASEEVPDKLRGFTAGLIPFKINRLTTAIDPIKYYEYRSAGLPVISTRFGEMRLREFERDVYLVDHDTDFGATLQKIKTDPRSSPEAVERFRAENTWQSRFERSHFFRTRIIARNG